MKDKNVWVKFVQFLLGLVFVLIFFNVVFSSYIYSMRSRSESVSLSAVTIQLEPSSTRVWLHSLGYGASVSNHILAYNAVRGNTRARALRIWEIGPKDPTYGQLYREVWSFEIKTYDEPTHEEASNGG